MKPPKTIYLQWHGEDEPIDPDSPVEIDEVTWCADKIFDSDIEYHLAPVWHDAKETPEEDGWYVVEDKYTDIRVDYFMEELGGFRKDVVRYYGMMISKPPEEK